MSATTPAQPRPAFINLVDALARETVQVDAIAVPFALKGLLKNRRYRWCPSVDGSAAAWRIEVAPGDIEAELNWLDRHVYCGADASPLVRTVTALERYRAP